ncbi:ABC transporter ATP-binding protein [Cryobacterium algoricola]|uniref:ABC transporter ATP-binding protein n=1 Tax=Cryobacterium algoricola TaxID=1259183 RepID=A0ABY2IKD8_9MICO|nr:ABC transporter ATP-binding protein [Cryobacterium algoricola]TFB90763.1 ABC transporter ATP-binding protein [Cryobacterium algoricola]
MSQELLRLTGVSRQYGRGETAVSALAGIDLTIAAGEMVAVMGASGSGKSTLLTVAGGLTKPTSGEVVIDGQWISELSAKQLAVVRRRTLGFVFQDFNLIPALTALENVTLPLELDGWRARDSRRAGMDALASVELSDRAHRFPDDLSGGQQQRVAIARAVVGTRRLILADEPTGALDSQTGELVLRILRRRVDAGAGAGAVLVTHDARHAAWADRVVHLQDGRIVGQTSQGTAEEALLGADR